MTSRVDIGELAKNADYVLKSQEHPDDRSARLVMEARRRMLDDWKDFTIFLCVVFFFVAVTGLSLWLLIVQRSTLSPETQKWAETIIFSMVSGSITYFLGKHVGKGSRP